MKVSVQFMERNIPVNVLIHGEVSIVKKVSIRKISFKLFSISHIGISDGYSIKLLPL